MKKKIIIVVAIVLVVALAVSLTLYFVKFRDKNEGNSPEETGLKVTASYEEVTLFSAVFDYIYEHPDRYENALNSYYGMSADKAQSVIKHPEKWLAFNFFITVNNESTEPVVADGLDIQNNGKNGIYIGTLFDGMSIIDANSETSLCVTVFLDDNDPSLEEAAEMIKDMDVMFNFSAVPEDLDAEIPEEDIYSVQVVM